MALYLGFQLWAPPISFFSLHFHRVVPDPDWLARQGDWASAAGHPSCRRRPARLRSASSPDPPPPRIRRRRLLLAGRGRGEVAAVSVLQADAAAPRRHLAAGSRQDPQGELLLLLRFSFVCSCQVAADGGACSSDFLSRTRKNHSIRELGGHIAHASWFSAAHGASASSCRDGVAGQGLDSLAQRKTLLKGGT